MILMLSISESNTFAAKSKIQRTYYNTILTHGRWTDTLVGGSTVNKHKAQAKPLWVFGQ